MVLAEDPLPIGAARPDAVSPNGEGSGENARQTGGMPPTFRAEQGHRADWEQRPLVPRSRCSQQLMPGVGRRL